MAFDGGVSFVSDRSEYVRSCESFVMTVSILKAIKFAKEIHRGQKYAGDFDFFEQHVQEVVVCALQKYRQSDVYRKEDEEIVIISALLHDCIEDGWPGSYEKIYQQFWWRIARVVWLLSDKYTNASWEVMRKDKVSYYHGLGSDEIATLIKEADREKNHANILTISLANWWYHRRWKLIKKYAGQIKMRLQYNPWVRYLEEQITRILYENLETANSFDTAAFFEENHQN
jgi:(p)ppGpp synthase/HD superfamily hydrolase